MRQQLLVQFHCNVNLIVFLHAVVSKCALLIHPRVEITPYSTLIHLTLPRTA